MEERRKSEKERGSKSCLSQATPGERAWLVWERCGVGNGGRPRNTKRSVGAERRAA
jgi:hypothetical protein